MLNRVNNKKIPLKPLTKAVLIALCSFNLAAINADELEKVDDENESSNQENSIIVTASRRAETLQNVGLAITSIDPSDFDKSGLSSIENLIDYTPGVNFSSAGAPGAGTITMRGVSQEAFTPVVGIYLDDVPLSSNTPYAAGANLLFDGVLGDIERVEIVKGPQGTLYGANAVGGVIRYVTKDPSTGEFRGSGSIDLSNTQNGDLNKVYRAKISVPLITDKLGISISGFSSDQAGYIDRGDEEGVNDSDRAGYNVSALWHISDDTTLKFNVINSKAEWDVLPLVNMDFLTRQPSNGPYQTIETDSITTLEFNNYSVTLSMDLDWALLTSVTAKSEYESPVFSDGTATFGGLADLFTGSAPGTNTVPTPMYLKSEKVVQEIRLTSPKSTELEWLAGFYYTSEDSENNQSAIAQPTNFNLFDVQFPSEYKETALFGNVTWYLSDDFDISFGARYSDNELALDARFTGLFAAGSPDGELLFSDINTDKVTTYSLGSRYRINEEMSLYVRAASGYRPAAVNLPIFDPFTGENIANPVIESDELWSYEFGIKGRAAEGKLHYDFALWAINWDEFQAAVVVNGLNTGGNATSGITANGFEGTVTYYSSDSFRIRSTFAYNNSELDADDATLGALKGEKSRDLPEWTASLKADYMFELAGFDGTAGLGIRYVGDYNTDYKSGVVGGGGALNFPIDSYNLVDLNVGLQGEVYSLNFYVTNLLDEYELASASAVDILTSPTTSIQNAVAVIVPPRTVGVVLSMDF